MRAIRLAASLLGTLALAAPGLARAEPPPPWCRGAATDNTARPLPRSLLPQFLQAFGPHMPAQYALRTGWVRCDRGHILGCATGANLPCGKADTRRDIPGADAWCARNGNPAMVPAYVTGHASIYAWTCQDGLAVPVRQLAHVDDRGFVAKYWRPLD